MGGIPPGRAGRATRGREHRIQLGRDQRLLIRGSQRVPRQARGDLGLVSPWHHGTSGDVYPKEIDAMLIRGIPKKNRWMIYDDLGVAPWKGNGLFFFVALR